MEHWNQIPKIYQNILEVITYLSNIMNESNDAHLLLEKFLLECIQVTNADSGSIVLLDEDQISLNPVVAIGLDKNSKGMHLKVGEGVTGWVAKHKKPRIINDAYNESDYVRVRDDLISEIAVPMLLNDQLIGVLSLDSKKRSAFTEEDASFLQIVANLSVGIFIKTRDNEQLKIREKLNRTLLEVSSVITKTTDLQDLFEEILNITQKVIKIYRGTLFLYDKKEKVLKVYATYGIHDVESKSLRYLPGEDITGNVFLNKKSVFISNIRNDKNFLNKTEILSDEIDLGFYCLPILSGIDAIGVVSIFTYRQEENNEKQILEYLQILGTFISQAITIQKLIEEEKQPFIAENLRLRQELSKKYKFDNIVGKSEIMKNLFEKIQIIANSKSSVLLMGESGTGKELIASAIHYNSPRKDMPFIKVNCAAIPESLFESELFGYKKGSFTGAVNDQKGKFELADGGTIFLDEIGEMSLSVQAKLLRVLQEKEIEPIGGKTKKVDIRIIAATNANIEELIEKKLFRADLFYRLNVIRLDIPPLRERKEDILYLTNFFIEKYSKENKKNITGITSRALKVLEEYDWPGNVRELENLIERAIVLTKNQVLDIEDFKEIQKHHQDLESTFSNKKSNGNSLFSLNNFKQISLEDDFLFDGNNQKEGYVYEKVIKDIEKKLIVSALKQFKYNKSKAAKFLGINRNTLDKKIKELKIDY